MPTFGFKTGEHQEEAIRRINLCSRLKSPALILSNLGLCSVPREISSVRLHLRHLSLAYNNLEIVEPVISELTYLETLDYSNNKLRDWKQACSRVMSSENSKMSVKVFNCADNYGMLQGRGGHHSTS